MLLLLLLLLAMVKWVVDGGGRCDCSVFCGCGWWLQLVSEPVGCRITCLVGLLDGWVLAWLVG